MTKNSKSTVDRLTFLISVFTIPEKSKGLTTTLKKRYGLDPEKLRTMSNASTRVRVKTRKFHMTGLYFLRNIDL